MIIKKLDEIDSINLKLENIRKGRLSEIDEILELFQGRLGLSDILNQDYSLITDLATIRDEKNTKLMEARKEAMSKNQSPDGGSSAHNTGSKRRLTRSSARTNK